MPDGLYEHDALAWAELGHRLGEVSDRITTLEHSDLWRVGAGPRP